METKKITTTYWWGISQFEVNHIGQKHGKYKDWYSNGNKCEECTYQNGEYHGLYKSFWSNGTIKLIDTNKKDITFGTKIKFKY